MLDVEVEGEMSPEGPGRAESIACVTTHGASKAGNGLGRFMGWASAITPSAGGESVPVGNDTTGGGKLAASSAVVGFRGRFWSRYEDESSESMAK